MFHKGVLKETEYVVVKQFSKFLFSCDRRNTVKGKENDGSGKFKLFEFFSRTILPLPWMGCCKPCLCPSCRGVNVISEVWGGILPLQGLSSAQLYLVVFPLTALTWCWPVGSIAVDADLVKPALQLTSQCSIKEDQGDRVCTGLGGCNSAIRFSLCDRKQRY